MRSPIAISTGRQRAKAVNPSRLINLYAEKAPPGSVVDIVLYGTPGLKEWATVGAGTIRAARAALGFLYVLSDGALYRVNRNGGTTLCSGAVIPPSGRAMMTDNGVQLGLLSDAESFAVTGTTITQVTSAYPESGATSIDYVDGYTIWTRAGTTGQWFISALKDMTDIDALDFATAESATDDLKRVLVDHREVWLFGGRSIEPWTNTGASPFPFERVSGALLERGTAAALSPAKEDNSVFWLGDDRIVYRAEGYQPVRISDHAVEEILRVGEVSDAVGMTYSQAGHKFYVLKLPTLARTLVYDAATGFWHERQSGTTLDAASWNVNCLFTAYGKTLAGGEFGKVYEVDLDTYTEGDAPLRSAIVSTPLYNGGKRATLHELELECELGNGLATGQGSDPRVMMRLSRDGGNTWSNERSASIGPMGHRLRRAKWNRNGAYREAVVEFSISDPVKRAVWAMRHESEVLAT